MTDKTQAAQQLKGDLDRIAQMANNPQVQQAVNDAKTKVDQLARQ